MKLKQEILNSGVVSLITSMNLYDMTIITITSILEINHNNNRDKENV
jgi:hypothetical protein